MVKLEVNADAASSASTMQEMEQRHSFTQALPSISNLHIDPTATAIAVVPADEKNTGSDHSVAAPVESIPHAQVSTATAMRTPVHHGFWKQRLLIRPPVDGDPRLQLSRFRKAVVLAIVSQAGCLGGFSSTIYFPSLVQITQDLNASQTTINASVSLFILFMGISPLVSSTLSDRFKIRRILYIASTLIFVLASLGGGFSTSAGALIVARIFQSIGSGGASILGAGTVADIYVSVAMHSNLLGSVVILELFFLLPETYRQDPKDNLDTLEMKGDAIDMDEQTIRSKTRFNPFQSVMLLKHPVVLLASIETGMIFALMFSIETIVPVLFTDFYGLVESQVGLTYLGAGGGSILGSMIGGKLSDLALMRSKEKNGGELVLEDRLSTNMWVAGFAIVPIGSLLFGWGAEKHLSIAAPIIGFAIYNFGMAQVLAAGAAYTVNCIPGQGSSATAAANFLRMVFACITSLIAQIIVDGVGYGYYGVVLAVVNIICCALFYVVKLKGANMRASAVRKEQAQ
ncbi:Dityrosine transporter 1 [Modicella reniformis]|uniref:Dityrosine transporter 1 n=1 Tax=Modicella reniformis TaxID=1440133 RepID=A0A9P6IJT6_9FUNG|nr:Dityrosine transporter 1 [Modicella reniformis]